MFLSAVQMPTRRHCLLRHWLLLHIPYTLGWHAQGNRRALRRGESAGERTDRLLSLLGDLGEHDLTLAGCQENVPQMRFMDSNLTRLAAMTEAMADADAVLRAMGRGGGSFALARYLPAMLLQAAIPAASHHRCAPMCVQS